MKEIKSNFEAESSEKNPNIGVQFTVYPNNDEKGIVVEDPSTNDVDRAIRNFAYNIKRLGINCINNLDELEGREIFSDFFLISK